MTDPRTRVARPGGTPTRSVEWMDYAACAGTDLTLFFPPPSNYGSEAKKLCAHCPVIESCRDYALAWPDAYGVWGGTTAGERVVLRRERRRSP